MGGGIGEQTQRGAKERTLLLAFRQAIIMILGALEDYLELPRSIVPKHQR